MGNFRVKKRCFPGCIAQKLERDLLGLLNHIAAAAVKTISGFEQTFQQNITTCKPMNTTFVLQNLLLGGLLGMVGQGIRCLAGLKKLAESTAATGGALFDTRRLVVSLLLGFIAGALGVVTLLDEKGSLVLTKDVMLTLIGMGYAGVDFIESFLTKYVSKPVSSPPAAGNATPANANVKDFAQPAAFLQVPRLPYSSN